MQKLIRAIVSRAHPTFRERFEVDYLETVASRLEAAAERGVAATCITVAREVTGAVRLVVVSRLREHAERRVENRGGGATMGETFVQDLRHATRSLRRNPGFTFVAAVVLAVGIGANSAIFSAVNSFLFRPLPFGDPDRLVLLYETNPEFGWTDVQAAPANAFDWREQVDAFQDVAMYLDIGANDVLLQRDDGPVLVGGSTVTGNFFDVLGVRALHGRTFTDEETWSGNDAVVMLSHHLWMTEFGGDESLVGRTIPVGGSATLLEVVGVMPPGFRFPHDETDLWTTYGWNTSARSEVWFRRAHFARPVARLKPDVTPEEANAQLQVVVGRLQTEYPETNRVMGAGLMPMRDFLVKDIRSNLYLLMGAVAVLLLLACMNVANLLLVRSADRIREVALRHALGAGRLRVARQFLLESSLLSILGGAMGLALGWLGVRGMSALTDLGIDGATSIALDARVVGFTLLAALGSGLLFGTLPALNGARGDLQVALREGDRNRSDGKARRRMTGLLVGGEVALALVLVAGAGLMVKTAWLLQQVDPGFEVDGVVAVRFTVPAARYPERDQVLAFWDDFGERLEARPGIERVGTVGNLPLTGPSWSSQFQAEGWPADRVGLEILHRRADPGYFEALQIPLLAGRHFGPNDGPESPLVVVVNETFVREHFPDEDPIGQRIAYDRAATAASTWYEIVGVVGDQSQIGPRVPARAEVFENRSQDWSRQVWVVLRTTVETSAAVPTAREVLAEMDPQIPVSDVRPLRDVWSASMAYERFVLTLLALFGATAATLAAVGVYGVTAQAARRRTREIGIRIALGAHARSVVGLMVRQGLGVIGVGLGVGLIAALLSGRALEALLFGVDASDPVTLTAVVAALGIVATVACYLPARRATRVDPVSSLRAD